MNLTRLALRNISGSSFRSWVVVLCALLVTGFTLFINLVLRGAETSLRLALDRLGADIIVVPEGTAGKVESALLMGNPVQVWMPQDTLEKVAAVDGVERVSPQLYLSTLTGASCCSVEDMFLVAYDPTTDFTIEPWLIDKTGGHLGLGEAVGGTYVFTPQGEQNIKLYGYFVTLKANLEPTGTGLDQSMFLTFETAYDVARISYSLADAPLEIPEDSISAVLVRVMPGENPTDVALEIMHAVPGVTPVPSADMFQSYRRQITTLLRGILAVTGITLGVSVLLIGLVFSMAANERRRELGVMRAMGATRGFVLRSLLAEAGLLALAGGITGVFFTTLGVYLFHNFIMNSLQMPFLLPSPAVLLAQMAVGLGLALLCVTVAALFPAFRISRMEPATAMRE